MSGTSLADFEMGMHEAFLVSFVVTLIAAVVSFLRPSRRSVKLLRGLEQA